VKGKMVGYCGFCLILCLSFFNGGFGNRSFGGQGGVVSDHECIPDPCTGTWPVTVTVSAYYGSGTYYNVPCTLIGLEDPILCCMPGPTECQIASGTNSCTGSCKITIPIWGTITSTCTAEWSNCNP
jgi:hypothetical protein